MDPLSVTASAVAIIGLLSQSCLFVADFLRNFSDAPVDITNHHAALKALHAGLGKIQDLHTENPSIVELTPEFSALVRQWLTDFVTIEAKLRKFREQIGEGKGTRVWARVTWSLSSDRWLGKFFNRVHTYHAIFSSELMLLLISISIAQSKSPALPQPFQTTSQPRALNAFVEHHRTMSEAVRSSPSTNLMTKGVENREVIPTQSMALVNRDVGLQPGPSFVQAQKGTDSMHQRFSQSAACSNLTRFLENFIEPSSIKSNSSYRYETKHASLALRFGPLIIKRFSQQQVEIYEVPPDGYFGLSIAVRLPMYFLARMNLALFAMRQSRHCLSFSLQWNISFPRVIPNSAPLMELARNGDISAMADLFKTGKASPNDVRSDGTSLLHVAALTNNYQLVQHLLEKGLNANMPNDDGETPLYLAIAHSTDYNISRLLINNGADLNNSSIDGSSPLHTFFNEVVGRVVQCHGEYLEANTKNSIGRTALHYLAWSSRSTIRDAKVYLSDVSGLIIQDDDGRTPLHFAARRGNIELAEHFLSLAPSDKMNQADCNGRTAFHYATESRRVGVLDVLKRGGMDIFKKDRQGRSVLHQAAFHGNAEAVKRVLAIAGKQELEVKDIDGRTPFQLAHRCGAHSVVEYLQSSYGLSLGTDAAMTNTSGSRSPPGLGYRWRKIIVRRIDNLRPAIVAVFVVCLMSLMLRDIVQSVLLYLRRFLFSIPRATTE